MDVSDPVVTVSALVDAFDWESGPLGAQANWTPAIRTAVDICLESRFPMVVIVGDQLIQIYNDAFVQILGASHPAALGQRVEDGWPEIWDSVGPMLREVLRSGEAVYFEDMFLPLERSGRQEERYFTFSYSAIRANLDVVGVFCTVVETTASVVREREASAQIAALAELDRLRTDFFNSVSHEFRTPLTLMLGPLADNLRGGIADDGLRTDLEAVMRNAQRLLRLVNMLLEFNTIEAGNIAIAKTAIDVDAYTADIGSSFRSAIENAGIEFDVYICDTGGWAEVDARLWEHVVFNLLSNALKFTFDGSIRLSLRRNATSLELTVSDTGVGLAPEGQAHVFTRFWRGSGQRSRTREGSGIGLALVHEIATLQAGAVSFISTQGVGSTVTFSIPAMLATPHEETIEPAIASQTEHYLSETFRRGASASASTAAIQYSERPHVLIVDDNADLRDYVTRILSGQYRVTSAEDGRAGLLNARTTVPDLIICDVMMPGMDGFEFIRAIRSEPRLRRIPLLLLSAQATSTAIVTGIRSGADGYILKPFSSLELLASVDRQLQRTKASEDEGALFRRVADQITNVIYMHDADGRVSWANAHWYEITRLPRNIALISEGWALVMPHDDHERILKTITHAFANGESYQAEVRFRPADSDSEYRWYSLRAVPMRDLNGEITGWAGSGTDIHERHLELDREHRSSLAFQNAALPRALPSIAGLTFSAVYEAANDESVVGGDWYDAFRLSDGRVVVSVGDVMGCGLDAAVTMGAVRQAIRGAAQIYADPSSVLDAVDRALRSEQPDAIVTAFVGVLDPLTLSFIYASAGHPPPFVRLADGSIYELSAHDLPLGLRSEAPRPIDTNAHIVLTEESVLILYTDGVTETTRNVVEGEERLRRALQSPTILDQPGLATFIRDAVVTSHKDDVAILALQIGLRQKLGERDDEFRTTWDYPEFLAADLNGLRRALRISLVALGASDSELADAELILGELLGNVVRHSVAREVKIVLDLSAEYPIVHVLDRGPGFTFNAKLPSNIMSESGRGLYIAACLTRDITVTHRAEGGSHARVVLAIDSSKAAKKTT